MTLSPSTIPEVCSSPTGASGIGTGRFSPEAPKARPVPLNKFSVSRLGITKKTYYRDRLLGRNNPNPRRDGRYSLNHRKRIQFIGLSALCATGAVEKEYSLSGSPAEHTAAMAITVWFACLKGYSNHHISIALRRPMRWVEQQADAFIQYENYPNHNGKKITLIRQALPRFLNSMARNGLYQSRERE